MPEKVREAAVQTARARTERADLSGAKAVGHNAYPSAGAMLTLCLSKRGVLKYSDKSQEGCEHGVGGGGIL